MNMFAMIVKARVKATMKTLNVARHLCDHVVGKKHSHAHRMVAGSIVMACGVLIAKIHVEAMLAGLMVDGLGYLVHGIGAIPFVEAVMAEGEEVA